MDTLKLLLFIISLCTIQQIAAQGTSNYTVKIGEAYSEKVTVTVHRSGNIPVDSLQISVLPLKDLIGVTTPWTRLNERFLGGNVTFNFNTSGVTWVMMPFLPKANDYWITLPGDSVAVRFENNTPAFSGKSADVFNLQYSLRALRDSIEKPTKGPILLYPLTPPEYFEWINWFNKLEMRSMALIDSYEGKVSPLVLNCLRDKSADLIIEKLRDLFYKLYRFTVKDSFKVFTINDLCAIYDSTVAIKVNKYFPYTTDGFLGEWEILNFQVARRYKFDYKNPAIDNLFKRLLLCYEEGVKLYREKPLSREQFLVRLFTEHFLDNVGYTPATMDLLNRYYTEPGFKEHKAYVKKYELNRSKLIPRNRAPGFVLTATDGQLFSSEKLKGKIVIMDFWFTGCIGCVSMTPVLRRIENEFRQDSDVVFLSISVDKKKEVWLRSIKEGKYTTGTGINLYTNGNGAKDYIANAYMVSSYPFLMLLDHNFRIVKIPVPDPRKDNGKQLLDLINVQRALLHDGPYVMQENDALRAFTINKQRVSVDSIRKPSSTFIVEPEIGKTFRVQLKTKLENEPSVFERPEKLLAISDIEGNFDAFKRLLQSNGVIDNNYKWFFGKGHLVINGDVFDRGEQVTECLWLIYSLEEQAKAAGGYVHFILGNHEIMNLSGDHRYAAVKYKENSGSLGISYTELYGKKSELGKWLRTKNIIEKIGDLLFVHAGISPQVNNLALSTKQINELARPFYERDTIARNSSDKALRLIFDTEEELSPFWYRLYYLESERKIVLRDNGRDTLYRTPVTEIKSVLANFKVTHIVTGHTLTKPALTLSVHYNNKVINTDTHHATGISEGLMIEGASFFRVNDKGQRVILFKDDSAFN